MPLRATRQLSKAWTKLPLGRPTFRRGNIENQGQPPARDNANAEVPKEAQGLSESDKLIAMAYRDYHGPRRRAQYQQDDRSGNFFTDNQRTRRYPDHREDHWAYVTNERDAPFEGRGAARLLRDEDGYLPHRTTLDGSFFDPGHGGGNAYPSDRGQLQPRSRFTRSQADAEDSSDWRRPSRKEDDRLFGPPQGPPPDHYSSGPVSDDPYRPPSRGHPGPPRTLHPSSSNDIPPSRPRPRGPPPGPPPVPPPGPPPGPPEAPPAGPSPARPANPPTSPRRDGRFRSPRQGSAGPSGSTDPSRTIRRPFHTRESPRDAYKEQACQEPSSYYDPTNPQAQPPPPLPLLVLDLNGTLVFRGGGRGNASAASKNPIRRPYLSSFLQYCLGLSDASYVKQRTKRGKKGKEASETAGNSAPSEHAGDSAASGHHAGEAIPSEKVGVGNEYAITTNIDEKAATRRRKAWDKLAVPTTRKSDLPHGAHFWLGQDAAAESKAASDAEEEEHEEERSTDGEAHKTSPETEAQDTIHHCEPPSREPSPHSSATMRLLVWSSAQPPNVDSMVRAMLHPVQAAQLVRCLARDTLVPSRLYGGRSPSVKDLQLLWDALNLAGTERGALAEQRLFANFRDSRDPNEDETDGTRAFESSLRDSRREGHGQHNTLLLDDSSDKARLQPYNHLLIPAFEKNAAMIAQQVRGEDEPSAESRAALDTVLLQTIGVIEHARWQRDISRWIYHGGLGRFAGMQHPGCEYVEFIEGEGGNDLQLRQDTPLEHRTERFWQDEGRRALQIRGIPIVI